MMTIILNPGVTYCKYSNIFPEPFQIRLIDGPFPSQGRLEVYHAGKWGTVCGHQFDQRDADVACKQLGYHYALGFFESGWFQGGTWRYGESNGPVWLDNIHCTGDEMTLGQCRHLPWGSFHRVAEYKAPCDHSRDVAVQCGIHSGKITYYVSKHIHGSMHASASGSISSCC